MNICQPFIKRPIATTLIMIAILLSGFLAYTLLPVSSLPEVEYPVIQVSTFYPGANPDVVASSITAPLEKQFGQMPGLNQMTSTSSNNASTIILQFTLAMSLDVAEQEVQAAINVASSFLPTDLPYPPIYNKVNPANAPVLILGLSSKTMPLPKIEDFTDNQLAQKISQLSGVGLVTISGGQRPAVRVRVNSTALAANGLTLEDVRTAIINQNVNMAKGNFDGPRLSYTINANDQLLSSKSYRPLILTYQNGAPLRLADIAEVSDGIENVNLAAWMNTTPAVILNIQRQPGANIISVVDSIKKLLPKLLSTLPGAIQLSTLVDRTLTIRASIKEAKIELLISIILVVIVIYIFLQNFFITLIPSFSVPLSLIGTLGGMYLLGFSINNLTLMALIIAAGFVVDDAIVMIENISRFIEQGESPLNAALKGSQQVGFTILSLSVSLIGVLIPLLFMSDVIGRLFREFAVTLTIAITISAIVSLTLTPMLCSRVLHRQTESNANRFERYFRDLQKRTVESYARSLIWVMDRNRWILSIAVITLIITLVLFYFIPKGFFPTEDTGAIQGITEASPSVSFEEMAKRQQKVAEVVLQDPAVANLTSIIGIDGVNTTMNSGRMMISLKPIKKRNARATEIIRRLQIKLAEKVPGIRLYMQPIQDLTVDDRLSRTQYQYSVSAINSTEVTNWSEKLLSKFHQLSELSDASSDQQNFGLKTNITIDRDTASRLGITPLMIDNILYDAFGQRQISIIFTHLNQYRVVLEATSKIVQGPKLLDDIYINSITGGSVPLRTFTKHEEHIGPMLIDRLNQFPAAVLSFNLAPGVTLGEAINAVDKVKARLNLPNSVQTGFEGSAKIFQNSLNNESFLLLAAIIVVYIVLGVLYESYIHPITILSTLPSACMGALLALLLTKNELSIIALIGIVLLIGIVMKNAILMVDFALDLERKEGKSPRAAIYEACLLRFRPILMTTLVAMLGAVPLILGTGMGTELRRPLGITIIAGLAVSQLLTLYTTPVIYLTFDWMAKHFKSRTRDRSKLL